LKKLFTNKYLQYLPALGWFFLVLYLICLPADEMPQFKDAITLFLEKIRFDKIVHFCMFGGIVALCSLPLLFAKPTITQKQIFILVLITIIWGLCTEFIQHFYITGRMYDLWDWAADSAGASFFGFLAWKCRKLSFFS
jgi:VanZ family protein